MDFEIKRGKQWLPKLQVTVGEIPSPQREAAYPPAAMEARCSVSYEGSPKAQVLKMWVVFSKAEHGQGSEAEPVPDHCGLKKKPSQGWRWRRNENQSAENSRRLGRMAVFQEPTAHAQRPEFIFLVPTGGCGAVYTCILVQGWGTDTNRFRTPIVHCQVQLVNV